MENLEDFKETESLAKAVVAYTKRLRKEILKGSLLCPDCKFFPYQPVTGFCGHTRCAQCAETNEECACGSQSSDCNTNILVQRLLNKIMPQLLPIPEQPIVSTAGASLGIPRRRRMKSSRAAGYYTRRSHPYLTNFTFSSSQRQHGMLPSPSAQYVFAMAQLGLGKYHIAGAHFACVAASDDEELADKSFQFLPMLLKELSNSEQLHLLAEELHCVFRVAVTGYYGPSLQAADVECVICFEVLDRPVTTPCGHTFCRKCILRSLKDANQCAVCRHPVLKLEIDLTYDNKFVKAAMELVGPTPPYEKLFEPPVEDDDALDDDVTPIFICITAYPSIPCPILILKPPNSNVIRRLLANGNRTIGLVTATNDGIIECGTLVQVRDCVQLEDGNTILSTVGIVRFNVIETVYHEQCHLARIEVIRDVIPIDSDVPRLQSLCTTITSKFSSWLLSLPSSHKTEIEQTYGTVPSSGDETQWWRNPHSPKWLWWIIAVLPLNADFRILLLTSTCLEKRMLAIARLLDTLINNPR